MVKEGYPEDGNS